MAWLFLTRFSVPHVHKAERDAVTAKRKADEEAEAEKFRLKEQEARDAAVRRAEAELEAIRKEACLMPFGRSPPYRPLNLT